MIETVIRWWASVNWVLVFLPPFLIWLIGEMILLVIAPSVQRRSENKSWVEMLLEAWERIRKYKWRLIFTAINLTALSVIFLILGVILEENLPALPEEVIDLPEIIFLALLFFSKAKNIHEDTSSKLLKNSLKYLYRGFSNPFTSWESRDKN